MSGMEGSISAGPVIAIAVSGTAGSGKSTLGRSLARSLRAPLIDLDTVTNPLLDELAPGLLDDSGHWLASVRADRIRRGRYAALRATAAEVLSTAGAVVVVAPFTAELRGGEAWREMTGALGPVSMLQLVGDERIFSERRTARGERRDAHRAPTPPAEPAIPVIAVDASLPTAEQTSYALRELNLGSVR